MEPLPLGGPTSSPAMTYPRKLLVLYFLVLVYNGIREVGEVRYVQLSDSGPRSYSENTGRRSS
jgi:hypothetical protein